MNKRGLAWREVALGLVAVVVIVAVILMFQRHAGASQKTITESTEKAKSGISSVFDDLLGKKETDHSKYDNDIEAAKGFVSANNYDKAIEILSRVVNEDMSNDEAIVLLADSYIATGKNKEAMEMYSRALGIQRGNEWQVTYGKRLGLLAKLSEGEREELIKKYVPANQVDRLKRELRIYLPGYRKGQVIFDEKGEKYGDIVEVGEEVIKVKRNGIIVPTNKGSLAGSNYKVSRLALGDIVFDKEVINIRYVADIGVVYELGAGSEIQSTTTEMDVDAWLGRS